MKDIYSKAYKEVIEILNFIPKKHIDKIPKKLINSFSEQMDKYYEFNPEDDGPWLEETKAILANMYRDYWATSENKLIIEKNERIAIEELEKEKRMRYNPEDIFKNNRVKENEIQRDLPVEIKKENFFKKILNIIMKFINKDK